MALGLRGAVFLLRRTWGNEVSPPRLDWGQGFTGISATAWLPKRGVCGTGVACPPKPLPWSSPGAQRGRTGREGTVGAGGTEGKGVSLLLGKFWGLLGEGWGWGVLGGCAVLCVLGVGAGREGWAIN